MKPCPDCPNLNPRGSMRCVLCNAGVIGNHPEPRNTWTVLRENPRRALLALLGLVVLLLLLWRFGPEIPEQQGNGPPATEQQAGQPDRR
ncbi:MAG: hypothetical protein JJT90_05995 [Ectothiorhodospiraceae bacterium]|nr:hypothetical protein [Ectothiorhodospiraceae bacterium]